MENVKIENNKNNLAVLYWLLKMAFHFAMELFRFGFKYRKLHIHLPGKLAELFLIRKILFFSCYSTTSQNKKFCRITYRIVAFYFPSVIRLMLSV